MPTNKAVVEEHKSEATVVFDDSMKGMLPAVHLYGYSVLFHMYHPKIVGNHFPLNVAIFYALAIAITSFALSQASRSSPVTILSHMSG